MHYTGDTLRHFALPLGGLGTGTVALAGNGALRQWQLHNVGNHEGHVLRGLIAGDEWLYTNPFEPARLSDDELAIADLLTRMAARAGGGPSVYDFAEAAQDHYLQLLIQQSAREERSVRSTPQPWSW